MASPTIVADVKNLCGYVLAGLLALTVSGCSAALKPIEYASRPETVTAPEREHEEVANLTVQPPVKVDITETYMKTVYADVGVRTQTVQFSSIASMKLMYSNGLYKYGTGYVVEIVDASGDVISSFIFKEQTN